jgi:hypothetical protein
VIFVNPEKIRDIIGPVVNKAGFGITALRQTSFFAS